jgi:hypothetical protein
MIEEALENTSNYESEKDKLIFELIGIYRFTYGRSAIISVLRNARCVISIR